MFDAAQLQPAYVLHSRPFQDTSLIVDAWTMYSGRQTLMVKGARKAQGRQPPKKALLQPFQPLQMSYGGRGEMGYLKQLEAAGPSLMLQGTSLYSGMYLNELLLRLLPVADPHPELFAFYQSGLQRLKQDEAVEQVLREFEGHLLAELGYHVDLSLDLHSGEAVAADVWYRFIPLEGVEEVYLGAGQNTAGYLSGQQLLALQAGASDDATRQLGKRIARANLEQLLGDKPLKSRELFKQMQSVSTKVKTEAQHG